MALQPLSALWIWLGVPAMYYAGAKLGVAVATSPEGIAVVWPPNGVLLAAMLLARRRDVPVIAALGIATEVAADWSSFSVVESLTFGVANALEATFAFVLLSSARFDARMPTLADLWRFLVAGPLCAALAAAALGSAAYSAWRGGMPYIDALRIWWLGDALGLLIFTPLLLALATAAGEPLQPGRKPGRVLDVVDVAVVALGLALVSVVAFRQGGRMAGVHLAPVVVLPCVVYLAARFDLRVVSAAVALVGLALAYAATHGGHPFGVLPADEQTLRAQEFILTTSLLTLGLTSLLGQLRRRRDELAAANRQLDELNRSLESRVAERTAELGQANRQLQQLAMTDPLTGLANRRAFFESAQLTVDSARRHGRALALALVDVDRFKAVNDSHGHDAGDRVLRHVATTLNAVLRQADRIARYGGEEFVVLAPDTDLDSAQALARRMGDALRAQPVAVEGGSLVAVTASFGVTVLGDDPADRLESMIRRADEALYRSKRDGRDRVAAAAPSGAVPAVAPPAEIDDARDGIAPPHGGTH